MIELRQVGIYIFGLLLVVTVLSAGALYAAFEGIYYVPEPDVSAANRGVELASAEHPTEVRDRPPVWIAPTPKYDYDPKLMIVKPREERLKEAELKRKQQVSKFIADQQADRKARRKIARQVREAGSAHAYQPEARTPAFGIFSIFR